MKIELGKIVEHDSLCEGNWSIWHLRVYAVFTREELRAAENTS